MFKFKKMPLLLVLMLLFTTVFSSLALASNNDEFYVVQKGDVLWKIADKYDVDWQTLSSYNNLKNPNLIFPGQKLYIPKNNEEVKITVLGTSDIHTYIYPWEYKLGEEDKDAGLAKVYTVVKEVREENPNTILIDNGDSLQGTEITDVYKKDTTVTFPVMAVMNYMKYDAWELGNHEFNYGIDVLNRIKGEAEFPVLGANIYNEDGTNFVKPYVVKEIDGVKVGILGMITPNVPRWDTDKVVGMKFNSLIDEGKKWVKILREDEKVDVVIASIHAGLEAEYWEDGGDSVEALAKNVSGIDFILAGHAHSDFAGKEINGALISEPKRYGNRVARFDITLEKEKGKWNIVSKKAENIDTYSKDASQEILDLAKSYHEKTLEYVNTPIGEATDDFQPANEVDDIPITQLQDTALVDFINKVQLEATGADLSVTALLDTGSVIKKGSLNIKDACSLYKYDNTLYKTKVTGEQLKQLMEWSANYFNTYKPGDVTISFNQNVRAYNYDMFSGVNYDIDISEESGNRIKNLTYKGEAVTDDMEFTIAINNYRYNSMVKEGYITSDILWNSQEELGDAGQIRNLLIQYVSDNKTISPEVDNNWKIIGTDLDNPLRETIIDMVNDGKLSIPTSEDGRTPNVKSLNVYDLIEEGVIEGYDSLTLLHTNDMHGFFVEGKYDGMGAPKLATKINQIKENNENVLVLDAGDATQGNNLVTLTKGENAIKVMNAMGYDAMTAGNHEFDYGKERLVELAEMAEFPILGANIKKEDDSNLLDKYIIKEMDGFKVGIFGISTPETKYKSHPKNSEGLTFADPVDTAKAMVNELKDKVDIIVALSHLGLDGSSVDTSEKLATEVDGIDVIIDGHSHTELSNGKLVNGTLIVQASEKTKDLGIVKLAIKDGEVVSKGATLFTKSESANIEDNATIKSIIDAAMTANEVIESEVVANSPIVLDGERENVRTGETNLGNLITEAMLDVSGADVALTNGGGIRTSIQAGEVTKGGVLQVLPFGNTVQVIEVTGADIKAAIENGIAGYPSASGAFPHIAGMTVTFDPSKEAGSRVVEIKVGGEALDEAKTYKLATNDFTAAGGDGYTMFKGKKVVGEYNALDQVLIDYINANGFEKAITDDRIKAIEDTVSFNIYELPLAA